MCARYNVKHFQIIGKVIEYCIESRRVGAIRFNAKSDLYLYSWYLATACVQVAVCVSLTRNQTTHFCSKQFQLTDFIFVHWMPFLKLIN